MAIITVRQQAILTARFPRPPLRSFVMTRLLWMDGDTSQEVYIRVGHDRFGRYCWLRPPWQRHTRV
jgi:hypothetical protein